jgi:intracellular sulfur oxidation DsrE/DsrF family protein
MISLSHKQRLLVYIALAVVIAAALGHFGYQEARVRAVTGPLDPEKEVRILESGRVVVDVTLHSAEQIQALLKRAQELAPKLPLDQKEPSIALVLHGPEIEFFARKNYTQYKDIVDLAAKMDAEGVIDVKVCETRMRSMKLQKEDLPEFVDTVPYGPEEVKRLEREGYTYL